MPNIAPFLQNSFDKNVSIFAHHNYSWTLDLDYDVEGDDAIFTATILSATNVSLSPAWFSVTNNDLAQI